MLEDTGKSSREPRHLQLNSAIAGLLGTIGDFRILIGKIHGVLGKASMDKEQDKPIVSLAQTLDTAATTIRKATEELLAIKTELEDTLF